MPLYEYACDACGLRFERIQKFSDPPVSSCPNCGQPVRKLISSPAVQFKGTGWYVTDYPKSGQAAKTDKSESAPKAEGGADKPAADASKDASKTDTPKSDSSKPATPDTK